jgi:predicted anti-sigma-YlaC factor YlaD
MACEEVQAIIPRYVTHDIDEEKIREVEEHLCVCNSCRLFLSQHIDKAPQIFEKKSSPVMEDKPPEQNQQEKTAPSSRFLSLEYIVLGVGALVLFLFIYLLIKG